MKLVFARRASRVKLEITRDNSPAKAETKRQRKQKQHQTRYTNHGGKIASYYPQSLNPSFSTRITVTENPTRSNRRSPSSAQAEISFHPRAMSSSFQEARCHPTQSHPCLSGSDRNFPVIGWSLSGIPATLETALEDSQLGAS